MPRRSLPELTKPELEVMKALWSSGRSSAREIQERAGRRNGWAYSTTRTTIERMVKKELLRKKEFHGIFLYESRISRVQGLASLVRDFADRVLEIHHAPVVSHFAEGQALNDSEIDELTRLLDEPEKGEA